MFWVISAINKLGIKSKLITKNVKFMERELMVIIIKNLTIDAKNSGTLGRLILGLLINTSHPIKLIGDRSLSKRDFKRITNPLSKFGVKFRLTKNNSLPLKLYGSSKLNSIKYLEKKGSAQCKSSVLFAGMRTSGTTLPKAKKSRNHTELLCKYLNLPIKIKSKKLR